MSINPVNNNSREFFKCPHQKVVTKSGVKNCYTCGVMIPQNENERAYKTNKTKFGTAFNPQSLLKSMKKNRQPQIELKPASDYFRSRNHLVEYMWDISEKLRLSLNSTHLAIYFMDFVMSKINVPSNQFQLYAATAVMLGAKAIELDERIPFISKLKRYSGLYNKTQEFTRVEGIFVKTLNWNLQCVTLIDLIEFYISQGVIFSNDTIQQASQQKEMGVIHEENSNPLQEKSLNTMNNHNNNNCQKGNKNADKENQQSAPQQQDLKSPLKQVENQMENMKIASKQIKDLSEAQIYQIVCKVEKEYTKLANLIIKDSQYYECEINTLATACVSYLRTLCGIENKWNFNLQSISKVREEELNDLYNKIKKQFNDSFSLRSNKRQSNGMGIRHSKTSDYDIENNVLRKANSYNSNYNNKNSFSQNTDQFDLISKYTNHTHSNNLSTHQSNNKYINQFPNTSSDIINLNQFNQQQHHQASRQRNSLYSGQSSIISGGISTLNSGNNIQGIRHQSTYLSNNYNTGTSATQFQHRVTGSSYVQKVYRVNSGLI